MASIGPEESSDGGAARRTRMRIVELASLFDGNDETKLITAARAMQALKKGEQLAPAVTVVDLGTVNMVVDIFKIILERAKENGK